jgi:hypothetical protein
MANVFISYSSLDRNIANMAVALLEERGHRCWIAPRDILPGKEWGEAIIEGIRASSVFVLIFSQNANVSPQILREVERSVNAGIPIIPFRIEDVTPEGSLEYFMSVPHWLDALSGPVEQHFERLAQVIEQLASGEALPPGGGALAALRRGDNADARRLALRGALGGLGLAALVGAAVFAGLGPPVAGLGWFSIALAFALPLAMAVLGTMQPWRNAPMRWGLLASGIAALGLYLWARASFTIAGPDGAPLVRGLACTADAEFIYENRCPALPAEALADAAYELEMLWTPASIAQAEQMIGGGWLILVACLGAVLGGYLAALAARRNRGS